MGYPISRETAKDFYDLTKPNIPIESIGLQVYATVNSIDTSTETPIYYVDFDGATAQEPCPVYSTLGESVLNEGDRVVVLVKNREGTIVGNITKPADESLYSYIEQSVENAGVQWIAWASNTTAPSADESGWSTLMPILTDEKPYLWQKSGDTIQLANVINGLQVFMNNVGSLDTSGNYTMIDGGHIKANTIEAEDIKAGIFRGQKLITTFNNDPYSGVIEAREYNSVYGYLMRRSQLILPGIAIEEYDNEINGYMTCYYDDSIQFFTVEKEGGDDDRSQMFYTYNPNKQFSIHGLLDANNLTSSARYLIVHNILLCWGTASITPTKDTPTSIDVTFDKTFIKGGLPRVFVTPQTSVPGNKVLGVGVTDITSTGCKVWIYRTNATETNVFWLAIGRPA